MRVGVAAFVERHRARHARLVGVHLRQGDYKTWLGGKTDERGTYMWIQAGAHVNEISSSEGGTFWVIELPLLADIIAERARDYETQLA